MHYHLVGIAGSGISGIAHMLLDQGHQVSGSDLAFNEQTAALAARGARIFRGHDAAFIAGADRLIATSAVTEEHIELRAARTRQIPVLRRADLWREWSLQRRVVAIAGTAGKTTTTAMTALILERAGLDPGWLIGGSVFDLPQPARWGSGPLVIEADEYDRTFLALTPLVAAITNIELDHVDCYPTLEHYQAAFAQFRAQVRGAVIQPHPRQPLAMQATAGTQALELGAAPVEAVWSAEQVQLSPLPHCQVWRDQRWLGELRLQVPGRHNLANALAALALAECLGLVAATALQALAEYRGTGRRFEFKGEAGGVTVIDDYAHHPSKVRAALEAARARFPQRRIVAYHQPHTFSRTRALFAEWPAAFAAADLVLHGAIYAAREADPGDIDGEQLAAQIARQHPASEYVGEIEQAARRLLELLQPGDVLITLGAGNGYRVGELVLAELGQRNTGNHKYK